MGWLNTVKSKDGLHKGVFVLAALLCLMPFVNAGMALVLGLAVTLLMGNPFATLTKTYTSPLLAISVVGLGAGMNLTIVLEAGARGIGYTVVSLVACLAVGLVLAWLLRVDKETSWLVTIGTAICGGSAIAAAAPAMRASAQSVSVAMGVVFCLNAVALLVFPPLGHAFGLSQTEFGYWAALAIHDTSSVVGAGMKYGEEALQTATTIKLARALWIVPLTLLLPYIYKAVAKDDAVQAGKPKRPWFIVGFVLMAALFTLWPQLAPLGDGIAAVARQMLVLTLFLVGANVSLETLRRVGAKPVLHGVLLWVITAALSVLAIKSGWIV